MFCNDLINDSDIEAIYKPCRCIDDVMIKSYCEGSDKKISKVNIYKSNVLVNIKPIERNYLRNAPLRSMRGSGKIAIHKLFVLKDKYRGKKFNNKTISANFHEKEMEIYRQNKFVEIQLEAAWSGITHWPKLGFEFYQLDLYDHRIYTLWSSFFSTNFPIGEEEKEKILTKYTSYKSIPQKYKKGFGSWLLRNKINIAFPMYKTVED